MIWTDFEIAIVFHAHPGYSSNPGYLRRSHMLIALVNSPTFFLFNICATKASMLFLGVYLGT